MAPLPGLVRKLAALAILVTLTLAARVLTPQGTAIAPALLGLGLFLLAGDLAADLLERIGLPHLTGYLLAGFLIGPHALGAVSQRAVSQLGVTNSLATALIALSAGAGLTLSLLRGTGKSILYSLTAQTLLVVPGTALSILLLRPFIPFLRDLPPVVAIGPALVWGTICLAHSPSSTLGVIGQLRPEGPLTRYALSVVITMDVVVLVLFALARTSASLLLDPATGVSHALIADAATELVGSLAFGTTLGLLIAAYLHLVGRQLMLFLLVVAYGASASASYFHFEPLLLFLTAGFVVSNLSGRGERLREAVAAGGRVVWVVFFGLAGARLEPAALARFGPLALALWLIRVSLTGLSARLASRLARDPEPVRSLGFAPLISQAGQALALSIAAGEISLVLGKEFSSLAVAVVAMAEVSGPIIFKWALDRAGESHASGRRAATEDSLSPAHEAELGAASLPSHAE